MGILHYACSSGNVELVKYLFSIKKFDINDKNNAYNIFIFVFGYQTILSPAFSSGNIKLIRYLLSFEELKDEEKYIFIVFLIYDISCKFLL